MSDSHNQESKEDINSNNFRGGHGGRGRGGRGRGRGRAGRGRSRGLSSRGRTTSRNIDGIGENKIEFSPYREGESVTEHGKELLADSEPNIQRAPSSPPSPPRERARGPSPGNGRGRGRSGRSARGRGRGRVSRGGRPPRSGTNSPSPSEPHLTNEEVLSFIEVDGSNGSVLHDENEEKVQYAVEDTCNDEQNQSDSLSVPQHYKGELTIAARTEPTLSIPQPPPTTKAKRKGVPIILSRNKHPQGVATNALQDYELQARDLSKRLAEAALEESVDQPQLPQPPLPSKDKRATGKGKAKTAGKGGTTEERIATEDEKDVSATDAIKMLPAQEVSITASTHVKMRRNESSGSLLRPETKSAKIQPEKKKGKSRKKKGLSSDSDANRKAARIFNDSVRACVERSDPNTMRGILRDKRNHNFALDAMVLETVMKAYVMAAMFDDALYCLRNCTIPETLSTAQTERILTCMPQNLRNSNAFTAADMINALCIATEFDSATKRTYFLRIVRGIALEFLEEATSARDRICSAQIDRLVRSGMCILNVQFKRGKKPVDLVVIPGDQLGVFIPDTMENRGIQPGDAVSILPCAGAYPISVESLDRDMIEATVTNTNPMVIRLLDKTNANLMASLSEDDGVVYRIDKLANRMGFNRQLAAAVAIASPVDSTQVRDPRRPCFKLIKAITAMDESIHQVMRHPGHLPRGGMTSTAAICAQAIPWNAEDENDDSDQDAIRSTCRLALDKYGALEGLNASQMLAVEGATSNRLTLVQGPPGTGKTLVAIRILQHWARLATAAAKKGEDPAPILATSDSNIAVDNLVEGCANAGLKVVRLGRPEAIRPELLRFCIDKPPSSYDRSNSGSSLGFGNQSVTAFKERMKQLKSAQVICCTCIGSGGDILDSLGPLERVLVDEATQATEPAVLVPLMRGCRQLVLVGDHCQLPPTVLSVHAEEEGHGVPLFSRMVACGVPPFMLDTQYRMHPCIAMFPSDLFYGGLLKNGVTSPERRPLAGFPWPREEFPVAFWPVKGVEMDDGVSKYNEVEATIACKAVQFLLEGGQCGVSDIAVVTPYAAQARLIRRMTRQLMQSAGPPYIEVSSVDGFQGREKEAVVFSAVRSNDFGAVGFTSDWRRVNVSFTRARRALIVIGNDQTLRRGDPDTWMPWLAWADAHGINMDRPGVPRGRYEPEQLRRVRGGTTAAEMLKDVLERQQAQLKHAERQQERAQKNTENQIRAESNEHATATNVVPLTQKEELALLENTDGNWDDTDSEEDEEVLRHSASKATLTSGSSFGVRSVDESQVPVDVWDL